MLRTCSRFLVIVTCVLTTACAQSFVAPPGSQPGQAGPVVKVYANADYDLAVWWMGGIWPFTNRKEWRGTVSGISSGTGFIIDDARGPVLLTASHVVVAEHNPQRINKRNDRGDVTETILIDGDKKKVETARSTVRVSSLSLRPVALAFDLEVDLAALRLADDDWGRLKPTHFKAMRLAQIGDRVTVWGFPGTAIPQLAEGLRVTAVEPTFFTLNQPVDPGYSGGPVVDDSGALVGIVVRSTDKQTRCISADAIKAFLARSRDRMVPYSDGQDLTAAPNAPVVPKAHPPATK